MEAGYKAPHPASSGHRCLPKAAKLLGSAFPFQGQGADPAQRLALLTGSISVRACCGNVAGKEKDGETAEDLTLRASSGRRVKHVCCLFYT